MTLAEATELAITTAQKTSVGASKSYIYVIKFYAHVKGGTGCHRPYDVLAMPFPQSDTPDYQLVARYQPRTGDP